MTETFVIIAAVLWIGAGVVGFFVGRGGSSPGCLIFLLVFIVTGGLGLLFFILGSVLGRNMRRDEMRVERHGLSRTQPGSTYHSSMAQPGYQVGAGAPPGWYPDPGNPSVQRYWDGWRWTHQVRWDGSAWVPF